MIFFKISNQLKTKLKLINTTEKIVLRGLNTTGDPKIRDIAPEVERDFLKHNEDGQLPRDTPDDFDPQYSIMELISLFKDSDMDT